MRYRDLRIGTKQFIGFGIILIFMTAVSVFAILNMATVSEQVNEVSGNWMPRTTAVADINISTSLLRTLQLQHAISSDQDQKKKLAQQIILLIDRINENLDRYVKLKQEATNKFNSAEQEAILYSEFDKYWEQYQDISFNFFSLSGQNRTKEALELMDNQAQDAFTLFSRNLEDLVTLNNKDALTAAARARATFEFMRSLTIVVLIVTVLISIMISVFLIRSITLPLRGLVTGVERVSTGELDIMIPELARDEIGHLTNSFNTMTEALRSAREKSEQEEKLRAEADQLKIQMAHAEARALEAENKRKAMELDQARELQISMLPKTFPQITGYDVAAKMQTASEVGGDYYDYTVFDNKYTFVIGDATGHGLHAGTMVTATKSIFKTLGNHPEPVQFIREASVSLKAMGLKQMYMALTVVKLEADTIRLVSAGMPFPLLFCHAKNRIEEIKSKGMPLGSFPDFDYKEHIVKMEPGDVLLLMSDGILEWMNKEYQEFDLARVKNIFLNSVMLAPKEIIDQIILEGEKWAGGQLQNDDITFLIIRRKSQ